MIVSSTSFRRSSLLRGHQPRTEALRGIVDPATQRLFGSPECEPASTVSIRSFIRRFYTRCPPVVRARAPAWGTFPYSCSRSII